MNIDENINEANEKIELESGTYEIIRHRLDKYGKELRNKINKLNAERKAVFGSTDAALVATERIITDNACIPADMEPIGNLFIFGYNVTVRTKKMNVADVFSVYSYEDHTFHKKDLELINDKNFIDDFNDLYKYQDNAHFVKFSRIGINFFMVFRTGRGDRDQKTFKWIIDGEKLQYVDNRSDHEFKFPKQHEFKWTKATREMHVAGEYPHVSVENILFVETTDGDLTIKAENNTGTGQGVYAEPVENETQTLDDAEFYYSILGNIIILKIKPYREKFRYIVYSAKTKSAVRIDAIKEACVLLPDNQGIIFSNGYYLQTGDYKFFENKLDNLIFERRIDSPNGEDFIYTFYENTTGSYVLLKYNLIEQKLDSPTVCHGYSIFENGEMCNFRDDGESKKHHVIQIWKTTFFHADYDTVVNKDSYLYKIGNKELVKGIAESREVNTLLVKDDSYTGLYLELVQKTAQILDNYYWIARKEVFELSTSLSAIKGAAASAIDEFEKVTKIKKSTAKETQETFVKAKELFDLIKRERLGSINDFVEQLAGLRVVRGELISLKTLRYVNTEQVESYEKQAGKYSETLSEKCIDFLLAENALQPYVERVDKIREHTAKIVKVVESEEVEEEIAKVSSELEMLIEIVSNLKIKDAVQTATIIDNISTIYSSFNKIKSDLKRKRDELFLIEGKAEFSSQIKLISQAVINYLDLCDTPEKTDEYLTKLLVQIEELEGKFTEFDEFVNEIGIKREEILGAFEQRKIQLIERRSKRADTLLQSASRILKAVSGRLSKLKTVSEINGYYASDILVDKVRDIVKELVKLEDSVKADEIQSRLKTVKEDAVRQLKDKTELFVAGKNIIKFGNYNFTVNTQPFSLTMVNRSGEMYYHLSGTGFYEKVENKEFYELQEFWKQSMVSENDKVYRSEYLAYKTLFDSINSKKISFEQFTEMTDEQIADTVHTFMAVRYAEGYVKGIHDADAIQILKTLINIRKDADLLRFASEARACAEIWINQFAEETVRKTILRQIKGAGAILSAFPSSKSFDNIIKNIEIEINNFIEKTKLFDKSFVQPAAEYLFLELSRGDSFIINRDAANLIDKFYDYLRLHNLTSGFNNSISELTDNPDLRYILVKDWLIAFMQEEGFENLMSIIEEATTTVCLDSLTGKHRIEVSLEVELVDFEGSHPLIEDRKYNLNYNQFIQKLQHFEKHTVVDFHKYVDLKKDLSHEFEANMRLNEFKPRVLSSFVRNKLINNVYLHLIGSNLAKQIGTAGEQKRTDLMGMLLLISPPGYGKTTLMEYIANRLGIIFMKINGPAIGHNITSVDPQEASNATAKEELEKLNLAFEIGDNVMIYLDDIQHCNPEFLQKFISLADGQRKIEGIYKGKTKTYDFRGKKVCIIMAGNPYTESGDKFQIPDMLSNRADIYNLGDILGDNKDEFLLSYIENSLTSNIVLSKLAGKSSKDVYTLLEVAETGQQEGVEYETNHTAEEINEYLLVLKKILQVRDTISLVNQEYIYSAGQSDAYRTEPSFKLQGSYRDMNKMTEKVMPIMNDEELQTLIISHYENESQTLTSDAEANLLKFKSMMGILNSDDETRYEEIKEIYLKNKRTDSASQIAGAVTEMKTISVSLSAIKDAIVTYEVE